MFEFGSGQSQGYFLQGGYGPENIHARRYNIAINQFKWAVFQGWVSMLVRRLLRHPLWLYDLTSFRSELGARSSSYAGIKVVEIAKIIGSEGRAEDFDPGFHPLSERSRERWINMAIAYLCHLPLPPVELVQVGDAYFVRDGHHRISVARAFGQVSIDAEVVVWKVQPPYPWQKALLPARHDLLRNSRLSP